MGFSIVKRAKGWKVKHRVDHGTHTVERILKPTEYHNYGLSEAMTIDEVRTALNQLRQDNNARVMSERLARIQARINARKQIESAWLPKLLVRQFENEIIPEAGIRNDRWLIAKEIIAKADLPPDEWHWRPKAIFSLFEARADSLDYVRRLLRIINKWGAFYSRKTGKAFLPIEKPAGANRKAIRAAYSINKPDRATSALTLAHLKQSRFFLTPAQHSGLSLMIWCGLRLEEIEQILNHDQGNEFRGGGGWYLQTNDPRFKGVLHVFQHKLLRQGIEPRLCWKAIPLVEPEQEELIPVIQSKEFALPSLGKMKKQLQFNVTNRSARKGFAALMQMRGYRDEVYDRWLGHIGNSTLRLHYETKEIAVWEPPVIRGQRNSHSKAHETG